MEEPPDGDLQLRRAVRVRGTVQGVGLRPAISRLAGTLSLGGFVRNDANGVLIEIEGVARSVSRFIEGLPAAVPAVARIESMETTVLVPLGERVFRIAPSDAPAPVELEGPTPASIPPDQAPCADCLRELGDPADRRHGYPFINCTACGPRFTIVRSVPYDRPRTTMAPFALCAACRREYDDPSDRRHHAEASACPACGPALTFAVPGSPDRFREEALSAATAALTEGWAVAVKGAGGFLLAVDARNAGAVARLRARKRRPERPFAVMARSIEALDRIVLLDDASREALTSPARPVVLVPARLGTGIATGVAPGLVELGVFLPATPLQQLLFDSGPDLLVMTSGNASEEPIARTNDEAIARLAGIADGFLMHDREVHTRADDSVVRIIAGGPTPLRRARGFVPAPIALPFEMGSAPPLLAVGAERKTTVCLVRRGEAILSQYLGDLHDAGGFSFFEETIDKLQALAGVTPRAIACDLHPEYRSSRFAAAWARDREVPCLRVQHHHAHVAACLVEHGRTGPVLGVAFDGTGLGDDGTLWGGEILVADLAGYRRVGHLRPLPLPGGEAAIRAPWRLAVSALLNAGEPLAGGFPSLAALPPERVAAVRRLCARSEVSPPTTGAGRWFDAVAALCGVRSEISYDGQAAAELEAIAADGERGRYPLAFDDAPGAESVDGPFVVDLRVVIRAIAADLRRGVSAAEVSARFHQTMADAVVSCCRRARERGAPETVALTGGCFQNRRLTELTQAGLERAGFEVLIHRLVPSNDGAIALGQAAIATYVSAFGPRLARHGGQVGAPCV